MESSGYGRLCYVAGDCNIIPKCLISDFIFPIQFLLRVPTSWVPTTNCIQ